MTKKKINKKEPSLLDRYSKMVLEGIDSKLDLVVKGHQGLDKKIDIVDKKVDGLHEEMNYKFELVLDELRLIRNELKEKVSRDEFALLEKRVIALEKSRKH